MPRGKHLFGPGFWTRGTDWAPGRGGFRGGAYRRSERPSGYGRPGYGRGWKTVCGLEHAPPYNYASPYDSSKEPPCKEASAEHPDAAEELKYLKATASQLKDMLADLVSRLESLEKSVN